MKKENYFRALKIALVFGTILNLINNYDNIHQNEWSFKLIIKILLTYSTPFFVSIYSSWKTTNPK